MTEAGMEEQLHLLQQEATLVGEAVDTLRRDHRAEIDALRLDLAVLQRCLLLMHPGLQGRLTSMRDEVVREIDPEAT